MSSKKQHVFRFHQLDLLRFIAAIAVVLFHYTFIVFIEVDAAPHYPVLQNIFKYGYLGVELFFMISGFVILLTVSNKNWYEYIVSRVSRLFPAYWFGLSLTTLSIVFFGGALLDVSFSQYLWNLTMVSEFLKVENIDPVYWTLQVEIKFYFWVFVILLFNHIKYIDRYIFGWLIFSILEISHVIHGITHFIIMPEWAPYFSAGALFYLIRTRGATNFRLFMLLLSYGLSIYFAVLEANEKIPTYNVYFSPYIAAFIVSVFFLVFIRIVMHRTRTQRESYTGFLVVGAISYPLYLIHLILGKIIYSYLGESINKYVLLIGAVLFMMLLAYLINVLIEKKLGKGIKTLLLKQMPEKWRPEEDSNPRPAP